MAEKYGVVPKKFSKEWWPYFWMYYKWHTIGTAFVVIMIAITAVQCATREVYDTTITYTGSQIISQDSIEALSASLEPVISDIDKNGENNIFIQQLSITGIQGQEEMDYAMQVKHDLELMSDTAFLFLYDKAECDLMLSREGASDSYTEVSEWAKTDIPQDKLIITPDGKACAVSVEGSAVMEAAGINTKDMYMAIRETYSDKELPIEARKCSIDMANEILK